jgi:VanZ family protein
LAYTVIVKKQKNFLAYAWFLILAVLFYVAYDEIENPYDKMHLFEYFALSFLFFRLLRHYMFNVWLYPVCAMLTMVVAITDESLQIFTSHRHFSFSDLGADFISALLRQISIALTIRPTLESYRYTLRRKKRHFLDEKRWLKKTTKKA